MARKKHHKLIRDTCISIIAIGFFVTGGIILWTATLEIPDLQSFDQRKIAQSTKIYDRTGEILLFDLHKNIQRTVIPFEEISRHVKNATVAIEDAEFYEHNGIKPKAILRAILVNIASFGFSQGGSTITQQVVKNSILTQEKLISRKIKEWVLSLKLEKKLSKEEILALYLNESPYGGNLYGIEEASRAFFNKSAVDITLAEAAYLSALPQAPTYYSPYGNNKDKLEERKNLVLKKMLENNFISKEEYKGAKEENVEFRQQQDTGIKAPHFVFFIQEYLEQKYGKRALEEKGFKGITTLNYSLQEKAEAIVNKFALENTEKFNAENAALIAIDPKTGHILSMVGSRNYFDEEIDGNFNAAISPNRQPGSAFKPFVYATAFKEGYTPETIVFDLKTQFSSICEPDNLTSKDDCYSPVNYDSVFRGPVSFRTALAQSINVPSVKVLYLSGLVESLTTARDLGITSLTDPNRYGLTLVLGGGEVSLIDITSAYGVFANDGIRNNYTGILRIEDGDGKVIEEFRSRPAQVLEPQIARKISDILSDENARAPAFGERSYLYFGSYNVAVKTGTTNDYRDAWIIGYSPTISVGAWAGNNDNSPMEKRVAGFIIAPLWNAFMQEALKEVPVESFKKPAASSYDESLKPVFKGIWEGGEQYAIDTVSGNLATEFTPPETREVRVIKNIHSILYWIDKKNPHGERPENPEKDPQFQRWEYSVRNWVTQNGIVEGGVKPEEYDSIHTPENKPTIIFTNADQNTLYPLNRTATISILYTSVFPLKKVDYFINGVFIGSASKHPFSISFTPKDIESIQELNTIKAVGYDSVFNKGIQERVLRIEI